MKRNFTAALTCLILLSGCHTEALTSPEKTGGMPYGKRDIEVGSITNTPPDH